MDISSRHYDDVAVVSPVGRIDHSTAASLEPALASYWANPATTGLVLDFSKVTYISSVGLRVLMIAAKQMRGRHARIAVTGLQPIVAEIFSISRFDAVLEVFPDVRDAVAAISTGALAAYDAA